MADKNFKVKTGLDLPQPLPVSQGGTGQTSTTNTLNSLLPVQIDNSGKILSTDGTNPTWITQSSSYSAPTLGSTSIASGATVSAINELTLQNPTVNLYTNVFYGSAMRNYLIKSIDFGASFTNVPIPGNAYNKVIDMNGRVAAVGTVINGVPSNLGLIYSNNNGASWISVTLPSTDSWHGGGYIANKYVVVGRLNAAYSTDLINWTNVSLPDLGSAGGVENTWQNVQIVNQRIYAVRDTLGLYSDDGVNWNQITFPHININSIVYANNKYTIDGPNQVASSTDGITNWVTQSMPSSGIWSPIAYYNGLYISFKRASTNAAWSTDAITWNQVTYDSTAHTFAYIDYINGNFIAIPTSSQFVFSSTDGITWTKSTTDTTISSSYFLSIMENSTLSPINLNSLSGVTSGIQQQLNIKAPITSPTFTSPIMNTISATAANQVPQIYQNITTGSINIGEGITSGSISIANAFQGAVKKTVNIMSISGTTGTAELNLVTGGGTQLVNIGTGPASLNKTINIGTGGSGTTSINIGQIAGIGTVTINGTIIPISKTLVATDSTAFVVPSQTTHAGKYLTTNGTASSWATITAYSAPTLGSTSIASGATVSNVSGLTINSTTIPTSATLTKTSDKLSVFSATTSAELLSVISDETGTGALVFGTSPTITTPRIHSIAATSNSANMLLWSNTITGSIDIGSALTSGNLNLAGGFTFAGNVNIASSSGTVSKTISIGASSTGGTTTINIGSSSGAISNVTIHGTVTAPGDINLSAIGGPGSLIDELNLILMGAI